MRPYETLLVLTNDLVSEQQALLERFTGVITSGGGSIDASHDWGSRKLAYPIKKQAEGRYYLLEYKAEPAIVSELERTLRITDGVLRYMSVQQEHTGLPKPRPRETERGDVPLHEMRGRGPGGYRPRGEEPSAGDTPAAPAADAPSAGAPAAEPAATAAPSAATDTPAADAPAGATPAGDGDQGVKSDE